MPRLQSHLRCRSHPAAFGADDPRRVERKKALRMLRRRKNPDLHCRCRRIRRAARGKTRSAFFPRPSSSDCFDPQHRRGTALVMVKERPAERNCCSVPFSWICATSAAEIMRDVGCPRGRCTNRDDACCFRHMSCRRKHCRPAQAMADQQRRRPAWFFLQIIGCRNKRSSTLDEKLVFANSPSLAPIPVKSNRNTAIPQICESLGNLEAAKMSLPQVKNGRTARRP